MKMTKYRSYVLVDGQPQSINVFCRRLVDDFIDGIISKQQFDQRREEALSPHPLFRAAESAAQPGRSDATGE